MSEKSEVKVHKLTPTQLKALSITNSEKTQVFKNLVAKYGLVEGRNTTKFSWLLESDREQLHIWLKEGRGLTEIRDMLNSMPTVYDDLKPFSIQQISSYKEKHLPLFLSKEEMKNNIGIEMETLELVRKHYETAVKKVKDKWHPLVRLLDMAKRFEDKLKAQYKEWDNTDKMPVGLYALEDRLRVVYNDIYKMIENQNPNNSKFNNIVINNGPKSNQKELADTEAGVEHGNIMERLTRIINARRFTHNVQRQPVTDGEIIDQPDDSSDSGGNMGI